MDKFVLSKKVKFFVKIKINGDGGCMPSLIWSMIARGSEVGGRD